MDVLQSFGFDFKLLITSAINFIILLIILNKIMYRPLLDMLERRKTMIAETMANADLIQSKLNETAEQEKHVLHKARLDAEMMIHKAEERAKKRGQEVLLQAETHARDIVEQARQSMEQTKRQMKHEIEREMVGLVMTATKAILQDKMPQDLRQEYVAEALKTIKRT